MEPILIMVPLRAVIMCGATAVIKSVAAKKLTVLRKGGAQSWAGR